MSRYPLIDIGLDQAMARGAALGLQGISLADERARWDDQQLNAHWDRSFSWEKEAFDRELRQRELAQRDRAMDMTELDRQEQRTELARQIMLEQQQRDADSALAGVLTTIGSSGMFDRPPLPGVGGGIGGMGGAMLGPPSPGQPGMNAGGMQFAGPPNPMAPGGGGAPAQPDWMSLIGDASPGVRAMAIKEVRDQGKRDRIAGLRREVLGGGYDETKTGILMDAIDAMEAEGGEISPEQMEWAQRRGIPLTVEEQQLQQLQDDVASGRMDPQRAERIRIGIQYGKGATDAIGPNLPAGTYSAGDVMAMFPRMPADRAAAVAKVLNNQDHIDLPEVGSGDGEDPTSRLRSIDERIKSLEAEAKGARNEAGDVDWRLQQRAMQEVAELYRQKAAMIEGVPYTPIEPVAPEHWKDDEFTEALKELGLSMEAVESANGAYDEQISRWIGRSRRDRGLTSSPR